MAKGWGARQNETLWHKTKRDVDYITYEGEGNRWKQSGIRDDVRPVTHEEGQVTLNERKVKLSKLNRKLTRQNPKTRQNLTAV